ncbi:MAG: hypothetical protein WDO16_26140 [Bacteroidota bacterium]
MRINKILLLVMVLVGCNQFEKTETLISEYKLDNNGNIRAYSIGTGATTKDRIEIRLQSSKKEEVVKKIEGFGTGYKTDIIKINDTSFIIRFTDTLDFKGKTKDFNFNIPAK